MNVDWCSPSTMADNVDTLGSKTGSVAPMEMTRQSMRNLLAAGILMAAGCGHGPRSVSDPNPANKIPAIETAVDRHDTRAIPQLVKDLNNDDPAIRFYAIEGLRKLTGQDFGYRYYDDDDQRKPAVARWNRWLASQR